MHQQPENVFGRRHFLQGAAMLGIAGLAGGTLASCGSPSSSSSSITFWNLFGGGDGARMIDMEQAFQRQNPASNFKAVTLAWGSPYYTKLVMSTVGDSPPNAAITHLSRLRTYAAANLLEPIDLPFLAQYGVTENDFLPAVWQRAQFDGKLYAIPLDTHPFVMYYNVDVCRKAGLLDSDNNLKPLQGPEALTDAFQRAQKVTGDIGLSLAVQDTTVWRLFNGLYSQLGGDILSPDGTKFVLNEAHAEQALTFMSNLTLKNKVANPTTDYASDAAVAVLDPAAWFSGAGSQFETVAQSSFEGALTGQMAVPHSLQLFHSSVQRLLDQPVPLPQSVNG